MSRNSNKKTDAKKDNKSKGNGAAPTARNLLELLKEIETDKIHIRAHRNDDPQSTNLALDDLKVHVEDINTLAQNEKSVPTEIKELISELADTTKYIRENRHKNTELVSKALDELERKITELQSLIENHEEELKT